MQKVQKMPKVKMCTPEMWGWHEKWKWEPCNFSLRAFNKTFLDIINILYWEWSFLFFMSKPHWKLKCTIPSCTYFLPFPFLASGMHQRCNYLLLKAFLLISLQKILSLCCLWRDLVVMMCWLLMNSTTLFQINPGFCCSFRGFEKSLYFLQQYVNVFKQI